MKIHDVDRNTTVKDIEKLTYQANVFIKEIFQLDLKYLGGIFWVDS